MSENLIFEKIFSIKIILVRFCELKSERLIEHAGNFTYLTITYLSNSKNKLFSSKK